jgi:hypothetical protein
MADYIRPTGLLSENEEKQLLDQYYAPKARPSTGVRRKGDPVDSANLPIDVLRGRIAGLLGLVPDVLNFMGRSPLPVETFGETEYTKSVDVPYGTEHWLKTLPLAPTSRVGQAAGKAASFVPLNPVPIGRAATAAVRATKGLPVGASIKNVGKIDDLSYRGSHTAPGPDFGAPLYDLTGGGQMYPADVYSAKAAQYYGTGFPKADREAFALAQRVKGNPDAEVTMYRAVPKDENITSINAGDWVTLSKDYAKTHGESALRGDYKILSQKVKAKDLWTNADSIHEFGYQPSGLLGR